MGDVTFCRYSPHHNDHSFTAQLVECYRNVFTDRPWNEWLKCPKCEQYWGVKDQALVASWKFNHCGVPVVDFWPREQVIADLYHEITPDASCWLAISNDIVIGFCWGYPMTIPDLEKKLGITFGSNFEKHLGIHQTIAYQNELGVLTAYRERKIAKAMIIRRLDDFLKQGLRVGIVRTRQNPEPSKTFLWYKKLGYYTLASYPEADGRVILGRSLIDLPDLLADK